MRYTVRIILTIAAALLLAAGSCDTEINDEGKIVDINTGIPIDEDPPEQVETKGGAEGGDPDEGDPDEGDQDEGDQDEAGPEEGDCGVDGCKECADEEECEKTCEDDGGCDEGEDTHELELGDPIGEDERAEGTVQVDVDAAGDYLIVVDAFTIAPPENGWIGAIIRGATEDGMEWAGECGFRTEGEESHCTTFSFPDYSTCGGGSSYPAAIDGEPYVIHTGLRHDDSGRLVFEHPVDPTSTCQETGPIYVFSVGVGAFDWDAGMGMSGELPIDGFEP